jgi:hypothetical protein
MSVSPPISPFLYVCRAITRLFMCLSIQLLSFCVRLANYLSLVCVCVCVCGGGAGCTSIRPPLSFSLCLDVYLLIPFFACLVVRLFVPLCVILSSYSFPEYVSLSSYSSLTLCVILSSYSFPGYGSLSSFSSLSVSSCPVTESPSVCPTPRPFLLPACTLPPPAHLYTVQSRLCSLLGIPFNVHCTHKDVTSSRTLYFLQWRIPLCGSYLYYIIVVPVAQQFKEEAVLIYVLGVWFDSNPRLILMRFSCTIATCSTVATSSNKYTEKQLKYRRKFYLGWSASVKPGNWTVVADILIGKGEAIPVTGRGGP